MVLVNDYVVDFVVYMNLLGVFCVWDVLMLISDVLEKIVVLDMDICDVMKLIGEIGLIVGVMEDGKLIGEVIKEWVFSKLFDLCS